MTLYYHIDNWIICFSWQFLKVSILIEIDAPINNNNKFLVVSSSFCLLNVKEDSYLYKNVFLLSQQSKSSWQILKCKLNKTYNIMNNWSTCFTHFIFFTNGCDLNFYIKWAIIIDNNNQVSSPKIRCVRKWWLA